MPQMTAGYIFVLRLAEAQSSRLLDDPPRRRVVENAVKSGDLDWPEGQRLPTLTSQGRGTLRKYGNKSVKIVTGD